MATVHWSDMKGVHFLSIHIDPVQQYSVQVERTLGGKKVLIPTSLIQIMYVANICGVDMQDQVHTTYSTQMNTKKWWHRLFFFALDATFAHSLKYKHMCLSRGLKLMSHLAFQIEVCQFFMEIPLATDYAKPWQNTSGGQSSGSTTGNSTPQFASIASDASGGTHSEVTHEVPFSQESVICEPTDMVAVAAVAGERRPSYPSSRIGEFVPLLHNKHFSNVGDRTTVEGPQPSGSVGCAQNKCDGYALLVTGGQCVQASAS